MSNDNYLSKKASLHAYVGDVNGPTVLTSYGYEGPIPQVGDIFCAFVYSRELEYHGRPDEEWPDSPGEKLLKQWQVIGRNMMIHATPWSTEPICTEVTLFVREMPDA